MPHKIGMLLTYTNRKSFQPLQKPLAQQQKPLAQQNPPAPMKVVHNTHSMRTIILTPGKSCSSCGH